MSKQEPEIVNLASLPHAAIKCTDQNSLPVKAACIVHTNLLVNNQKHVVCRDCDTMLGALV